MTLQQVSLSGVIICPDQELEQRFAVNSFTVASFLHYRRHATQAFEFRQKSSFQAKPMHLPSRNQLDLPDPYGLQ
jgi:hypothetical protein